MIREVINELKKYTVGKKNSQKTEISVLVLNRLIFALEEQEPWISVSKKLPEIHNCSDNYLVTLKRGGVHIAMFTECDGKHWWTYDDVEAWMPLPKPYKTESER